MGLLNLVMFFCILNLMSSKPRILIVEDEPAIRIGLVDVFVYHGYEVEYTNNGNDGLHNALSGRFDLVLLDVMLPGLDGFNVCNRIREQDPDLAIIMLTAKSSDQDIIEGLALGADDYVAKPFSVAQLVLRVQAVLRRTMPPTPQEQYLKLADDVLIDCLNLTGQRGKEHLKFTRREIGILQYLIGNSHRPIAREELLAKVWCYKNHQDIETRTVDIHIAKLRRKIERNPAEPQYLITVRGAGYRLLGVKP